MSDLITLPAFRRDEEDERELTFPDFQTTVPTEAQAFEPARIPPPAPREERSEVPELELDRERPKGREWAKLVDIDPNAPGVNPEVARGVLTVEEYQRQRREEAEQADVRKLVELGIDPTEAKAKAETIELISEFFQVDPEMVASAADAYKAAAGEANEGWEQFLERQRVVYEAADMGVELADLYNQLAYNWDDEELRAEIEELEGRMPALDEVGRGFLERSFSGMVSQLPMWVDMAKRGGAYAAGLSVILGLAGAAAGGPPLAATGFMLGLKGGGVIGGVHRAGEIIRGRQFQEFLAWEDDEGNTMDPEVAWAMSSFIAAGSSIVEVAQVATVLSGFKVPAAVAKSAMGRAMAKLTASKAFGMVLTRAAARAAAGTASEAAEEGLQKSWELLGEYFAIELSNARRETPGPAAGAGVLDAYQWTSRETDFEHQTLTEAIDEAWNETTNAAVSFWMTQLPSTLSLALAESRTQAAESAAPPAPSAEELMSKRPQTGPQTLDELTEQMRVAAAEAGGDLGEEKAAALGSLVRGAATYLDKDPDEYVRERFAGAVAGGTPAEDALFSYRTLEEWSKKATRKAEKAGIDPEAVAAELPKLERLGAILQERPELLAAEGRGNPVRVNSDYIKTVDFNTNCPRRMQYAADVAAIEEELGRPMSSNELLGLSAKLLAEGEVTHCLYCYVEAGRRAFNDSILTYASNNPGFDLNGFRLWWKARTSGEQYAVSDEAAASFEAARKYAQSASLANAEKMFDPYRGQLWGVTAPIMAEVNARAGMRYNSNTDFQVDQTVDYMQSIVDLALMGSKAHAYTKEPAMAEIFGETGMRINQSVFAREEGGQIVEDTAQGMAWEDAKRGRAEHPENVGTIMVATSDEQIRFALGEDWIDMIIPYHRSGMTSEQLSKFGWTDYTFKQGEKWIDKKAHRGEKAPHFVYEQHQNDKETYLELCREAGVRPRFEEWVDDPNYMKLIVDAVKADIEQKPVQPVFDYDAAERVIREWQEEGGYTTRREANLALAESMVERISAGDELFKTSAEGVRRASVEFEADGEALIRALEAPTVADMAHELGHVFRRDLTPEDLAAAEAWAGAEGGVWTPEAEERFANGFERYLRDGQAPNAQVRQLFERFADWLRSIYQELAGTGLEPDLSPEMREVFDKLTAGAQTGIGLDREGQTILDFLEAEADQFQTFDEWRDFADTVYEPDELPSDAELKKLWGSRQGTPAEAEEASEARLYNGPDAAGEQEIAYGSREEADSVAQAIDRDLAALRTREPQGSGTVPGRPGDRPAWQTAENSVPGSWRTLRRVDFTGKRVESEAELAELFQVYRHPRIEHFHVILTDPDGTIVSHTVLSSGVPGMSQVRERPDPSHSMYRIQRRMEKTGAANVWILHNHPSGEVTPSAADKGVTANYKAQFGQAFRGHVIIDHGTAHYIAGVPDRRGLPKGASPPSLWSGPMKVNPVEGPAGYDPDSYVGPRVASPEDIGDYAASVVNEEGKTAVVVTDWQNQIIAMVPVRSDTVTPERAYQIMREHGGSRTAIVTGADQHGKSKTYDVLAGRFQWQPEAKYRTALDVVKVWRDENGDVLTDSVRSGGKHWESGVWIEEHRKTHPGLYEEEGAYEAPGEAAVRRQLAEDAKLYGFETEEEFRRYAETMYDEETLPDAAALAEIYAESERIRAPRYQTYEQANRAFAESVDEEFVTTFARGLFALSKGQRPRGLSPLWWAAAKKLGPHYGEHGRSTGSGLKPSHAKKLITMMQNNPAFYRALSGQVLNDPELLRDVVEGEEAYLAAQEQVDAVVAAAEEESAKEELAAKRIKDMMVPPKRQTVKARVRETTGQRRTLSRMVAEDEALRAKIKAAEKASDTAYRAGQRIGAEKEKARKRALEARLKENQAERAMVGKWLGDLKKAERKLGTMDPRYKKEIQRILEGVDLVWRRNPKTVAHLERTLEYFQNNPEAEIPPDVADRLAILGRTPYGEMELADMEAIHKAVMHAVHLNKMKQELRVGQRLRTAEQVREEAIEELKPVNLFRQNVLGPMRRSKAGKAAAAVKNFLGIQHEHYDLVVEKLAGARSTSFQLLYRDVKDGINRQRTYRQQVYHQFQKDLGELGFEAKDTRAWLDEKVELGRWKLTRGHKISLYLHSLNEDNLTSILAGGIGFRDHNRPNEVFRVREKELAALLSSVTEEEKRFAEAAQRLFARQGEELATVFLEKNGYELETLENYFPKDVMPVSRYTGKDVESQEFIDQFKGQFTRVGVPKGMLQKRMGVHNPIYLNDIAYDINRSVLNAGAYIGLEIPLTNASRLLYHPEYKQAIIDRYGKEVWAELDKSLRDIAGEHTVYQDLENVWRDVRANMAVYSLGINPAVMFKQLGSWFAFSVYVDWRHLLAGTIDSMTHPKKTREQHLAWSVEFEERVEGGYSRDVAEVYRKEIGAKRLFGTSKGIKEKLMAGIQAFDAATVSAGMRGAVLQALDEFEAGDLSREVSEALNAEAKDVAKWDAEKRMRKAYEFAEWTVQRTQPMFAPEHMSRVQKGGTLAKMFTMFSSFTNQELNMVRRAVYQARQGNYRPLAMTAIAVAANFAAGAAIDAARDELKGRDKKGLLELIADKIAGWFFGVRDIEKSLVSKIERGTFSGQDMELPLQRYLGKAVDGTANIVRALDPDRSPRARQRDFGQGMSDIIDFMMMSVGVPYQIKSTTERVIEEIER